MKRILIAAALASANLWAAMPSTSAMAQGAPSLQNSQIDIAYVEPSNADYQPIYERLKKRQVLEELREFLAPLKLPRKVAVRTEQCNQTFKDYQPGGAVTVCYEYVAQLGQLAATIPADGRTARGVTRADAIVGAFVQIVLHDMSHAVFDILKVPVWGREEDAADKLAGFLMLQFGTENARKLLNGAAYFFEASDRTWTGSDFSDVRGTEAQRFYNYLCVAYGGDQEAFKDFLLNDADTAKSSGGRTARSLQRADLLPSERAVRCPREYTDLKYAFDMTIMPHVDQNLLKVVLAKKDWLPGDVK